MNARVPLLLLAFAAFTAAGLIGAETAQRPGSATGAITEARKELQAIRADAANPLGPTSGTALPSIPTIGTGEALPFAPAAPVEPSVLRDPGATQSRGWLVDAMEREARRTQAARSPRSAIEDADLPTPNRTRSAGEPLDLVAAMDERYIEERIAAANGSSAPTRRALSNPFDNYLGQWMAPDSFDIWQRESGGPTVPGLSGLDGSTDSRLTSRSPGLDSGTTRVSRAPQENPYLAAVPPPQASLAPAPNPAPPASLSRGQPVQAMSPAPAAAARRPTSVIPEVFRRSSDERYFPGLKRF